MAALRSSHSLRPVSALRSFSCSAIAGIDGLGEFDELQSFGEGVDPGGATFE